MEQEGDFGIDFSSRSFSMACSARVLQESPSADLTWGRLSVGDQQEIGLVAD